MSKKINTNYVPDTKEYIDRQPLFHSLVSLQLLRITPPVMQVMMFMTFFVIQSYPAIAQKSISQTDLVGTSYTLCVPSENEVYAPNQALSCFEYQLRENGQAIRMFWVDRLDTGLIENQYISHHAWILDGDIIVIQGEKLRYGEDPILYYDFHQITENGNLNWLRREVDKDSGTEIQDIPENKKILLIGDPKGPAKFKAQMERYSRWIKPAAKDWDPEAYWLEIVQEYPARYLRAN